MWSWCVIYFFFPSLCMNCFKKKNSGIYRKKIYILWRSRNPVFFLYKSLKRMYCDAKCCIYYYICARGVLIWFSLSADSCLKLWSRWLFFEVHGHMLFLGINNRIFFGAGCTFRLWMMLGGIWVSDKTAEGGGKAADSRRSWQLLREFFFSHVDLWPAYLSCIFLFWTPAMRSCGLFPFWFPRFACSAGELVCGGRLFLAWSTLLMSASSPWEKMS